MNILEQQQTRGFTLIEVLTALFILSALALISYRGLAAVLDAREHVAHETEKWQHITAFLARFEQDIQLAAPQAVRSVSGSAPAWRGHADSTASSAKLEFSRFASIEGADRPRRMAYTLNAQQEIELWLSPALDNAPGVLPVRYAVLRGVNTFELLYLNANRVWVATWPTSPQDAAIPRAVRVHIVLTSGEDIVRLFALNF